MEMCDAWFYQLNKGEEKVLGIVPFFHVYGMTAVLNFTIRQGYEMILLPSLPPVTFSNCCLTSTGSAADPLKQLLIDDRSNW